MLKQIIWFFILFSGTLVSAEFKNSKQPDIKMVLALHCSELRKDKEAQLLLYNYSQSVLRRLEVISYHLKQKIDCKTVTSLKKNDLDSFIASVCHKCARKNYDSVGCMHDMARARASAEEKPQIPKIMKLVKIFSENLRFKQYKIIPPRRPLKIDESINSAKIAYLFGYPRFHVVFIDENGFMVEWQFETIWTSMLCETAGDIFPKNFLVPKHYRNDLHDVAYRLFFKMIENAKNDNKLMCFLNNVWLEEYLFYHDVIIGCAHEFPKDYLEEYFVRDLELLHKCAAKIISEIITVYGQDYLLKQME